MKSIIAVFSGSSFACHRCSTSSLCVFGSRLSSSSLASVSTSFHPGPLRQRRSSPAQRGRFSRVISMASIAVEPVEVLVKAATGEPEKLGDCPFCHRVLLTLEEKGVPYDLKLVDLANKPDWFVEINPEGKVPVVKHEGKWVPDSDVITQIIEERYPEPPLQTPADKASVGSKVFSSFVKFLKSKDSSDGSEEALVAELTALNVYLKENGPFIAGDKITAADLSLAPKLLHLKVALAHYKKWSIPSDLTYLNNYMEAVHTRESFVKTKAADEHIVAGWQKHMS
ncbi:hypothetical protein GOP47_0015892 [Adiantum capillus-veneris]|uniref:Dehydroascorbate reductase n=1 Tax=Adiantum capillus-veneris TaxID=13818 RepID=A0A9D4UKK8_ADICA|nr:hypothetical protein GOP47_0015892 [Adiantum capillus-veneris]